MVKKLVMDELFFGCKRSIPDYLMRVSTKSIIDAIVHNKNNKIN
jgi:hypothetical protein